MIVGGIFVIIIKIEVDPYLLRKPWLFLLHTLIHLYAPQVVFFVVVVEVEAIEWFDNYLIIVVLIPLLRRMIALHFVVLHWRLTLILLRH